MSPSTVPAEHQKSPNGDVRLNSPVTLSGVLSKAEVRNQREAALVNEVACAGVARYSERVAESQAIRVVPRSQSFVPEWMKGFLFKDLSYKTLDIRKTWCLKSEV